MREKSIIILVIAVILIIITGIAAVSYTNNDNNTTNTTNNTTTIETNNTTTSSTSNQATSSSSHKSSTSKSSDTVDVENQKCSYTRDQPTKTVNSVTYNLIYNQNDNPSYWESSDGQIRTKIPLKKNSKQ